MKLRPYPFRQGICVSLCNFLPVYIIYFISNKRNDQLIRVLLLTNLIKPLFSLLQTIQICHIVNQKDALRACDVLFCQRLKPLLARCVPEIDH